MIKIGRSMTQNARMSFFGVVLDIPLPQASVKGHENTELAIRRRDYADTNPMNHDKGVCLRVSV